jgi:hypothetical protein
MANPRAPRAWPGSILSGNPNTGNPNTGQPQQGTKGMPSDQRFRSFAERYLVARAHLLTADPQALDEETWRMIQSARTAYRMIDQVGKGPIEPEDF